MHTIYYVGLLGVGLCTNGVWARSIPTGNTTRIIHTNDIHSHFDEFNDFGADCTLEQKKAKKCYGGVARLRTVVDELRQGHPETLLFDAGDQFQVLCFYCHREFNYV